MARYEVVIKTKGQERVVATTRRENGAIAERDIAADSEYRNKLKRTEDDPNAYVVRGAVEGDPNAEGIVYFETAYPFATIDTIITYRRVPPIEYPEPNPPLVDQLLASLILLDIGARL